MSCRPRVDAPQQSEWFKSSVSSSDGSCVEVRFHDDLVSIRDSKYRRDPAHDPHREPILTVTAEQWTAFLNNLTDPTNPRTGGALLVESSPGGPLLRATDRDTTLHFTHAEWQSFLTGVHAHEFDHPRCPHPASI
ncbi:MAG: DUF397 domain-containing protein [Pseudonocardia sp.]